MAFTNNSNCFLCKPHVCSVFHKKLSATSPSEENRQGTNDIQWQLFKVTFFSTPSSEFNTFKWNGEQRFSLNRRPLVSLCHKARHIHHL